MLDNYSCMPDAEETMRYIRRMLVAYFPDGRFDEADLLKLDSIARQVASEMTGDMIRAAFTAGDLMSVATSGAYREAVFKTIRDTLQAFSLERIAEAVNRAAWDERILARLGELEAAGRDKHWQLN